MSDHERTERPERPERPGFRDIWDAVDRLEEKIDHRFATKSDLRMWVAVGIVGGQGVAAAVTGWITRMTPVQQAAWLYGRTKGWV